MKLKGKLLILGCLMISVLCSAQSSNENMFSLDDSLRGTLNKHRDWWNVVRYDLEIVPDILSKSVSGNVKIIFAVTKVNEHAMQIDLQSPLVIDSALLNEKSLAFKKQSHNTWLIEVAGLKGPSVPPMNEEVAMAEVITIFYHGTPKEAVRAPWDGGLIWTTDTKGNPWIATAVEGLGASAWWPCKDHLSDKPESGMSVTITAPDTLTAISNGKLVAVTKPVNRNKKWTWAVKYPINNYNVTMNIGKYVNFTDTLIGEGGKLDLSYWVLPNNLEVAKKHFEQVKPMLHCFEYWFGKYPFYEDGYKLVEAPFLGMEHQSAVAYGNGYQNGYLGRDRSGSGWGLKWDFVIVHESGHEWFGNNITMKDAADMWIHESFTNHSEALYTECMFGKEAGNDYQYGVRMNIKNDKPIIGLYGVNKQGSGGDMYWKGSSMLQTIRHAINNDDTYRKLLRGLNQEFYHQTVTTNQIEDYINLQSGINFSKTFHQYLRTTQVPLLEYYFEAKTKKVFYRWSNCIPGFDLPLVFKNENTTIRIQPAEEWKSAPLRKGDETLWLPTYIERNYYISVRQVQPKH